MGRPETPTAIQAIWPLSSAPESLVRCERSNEHDSSITGVLIFSGIGLGLTAIEAVFQWLELPPPSFF
jgi:hypothetical protein